MKIIFTFSCSGMFRDVPECSEMFHVPGFIDAPLVPCVFMRFSTNFQTSSCGFFVCFCLFSFDEIAFLVF